MTTQFDSNTFEHDYIISVLMHMVTDLKTDKPVEQIIDKYAVSLTAFMTGMIVQAVVEPHKEKSNVDGEGYWCVVCERLLFPDEYGVIVHDDKAHPSSMAFDDGG